MNKKLILALKTGIGMLMLLILVFFAITAKRKNSENLYNENWNSITAIQLKNTGTIPTYYDNDKNNVYIMSISHNITDEMCGKTLAFKTDDAYVDVYISEKINSADEKTSVFSKDNEYNSIDRVYHFGKKLIFTDSPGSRIHFINIPDEAAGSVTIRIETGYKNDIIKEDGFYVGSNKEVKQALLNNEKPVAVLACLLFMIGIIVTVFAVSFGIKKLDTNNIEYLGALALSFSLYFICRCSFGQFIIGSPMLRYYVRYLALFAFWIITAGFIQKSLVWIKLNFAFYVTAGFTALILLLHFLRISSFSKTSGIYTGGITVIAVVTMVYIARTIKKIYRELEEEYEAEIDNQSEAENNALNDEENDAEHFEETE